jgi:hypothetical protein
MTNQIGRNDPCPCGSGKKHKTCCWAKTQPSRKKISAKLLSGRVNLMDRAFSGQTSNPKPLTDILKPEIVTSPQTTEK